MNFLQKNKYTILLSLFMIVGYFCSRLILLLLLPIFTDEAIYIRWAQISLNDASWRFISLTDGKQPLFIWIMMISLKFINDPLLAGRLISVFAGFGTLLGLYVLSYELFKNKTVSFIAAFVYIFYPLALLHDRLAIYDSMVAMWYIWSLYFSIRLVKKITLVNSYQLGFVLGASVLTKSGGFLSMALLPFTLLIFPWKSYRNLHPFTKLVTLGIVSIVIGYLFYGILRLSPLYGMIETKNAVFLYTLKEWLQQSIDWRYTLFLTNFEKMFLWFLSYFNIFYILFLIIGFISWQYRKEKILIAVYFLLPFLYAIIFGKVLFPRYILFMSDILLPIVAYGIFHLANVLKYKYKKYNMNFWASIISFVTVLPTAYISFFLIFFPLQAPIPLVDRSQYMTTWPAGWGIKEAISYIQKESATQKVYLATQGTFGLMPYAFEMYLLNNPNVTIKAYWPIDASMPEELLVKAQKMPTYVYFYEPCTNCSGVGIAPVSWPLLPVLSITKGDAHAVLYKVTPQQR